jgi:hypothetical protein
MRFLKERVPHRSNMPPSQRAPDIAGEAEGCCYGREKTMCSTRVGRELHLCGTAKLTQVDAYPISATAAYCGYPIDGKRAGAASVRVVAATQFHKASFSLRHRRSRFLYLP